MWHRLTHRFRQDLWENVENLPVPGYAGTLYRQRCKVCGDTRVQELPRPKTR
jgi:hypothetical protein